MKRAIVNLEKLASSIAESIQRDHMHMSIESARYHVDEALQNMRIEGAMVDEAPLSLDLNVGSASEMPLDEAIDKAMRYMDKHGPNIPSVSRTLLYANIELNTINHDARRAERHWIASMVALRANEYAQERGTWDDTRKVFHFSEPSDAAQYEYLRNMANLIKERRI